MKGVLRFVPAFRKKAAAKNVHLAEIHEVHDRTKSPQEKTEGEFQGA